MNANKKRDIAKDFADFLLNESKDKPATTGQGEALIMTQAAAAKAPPSKDLAEVKPEVEAYELPDLPETKEPEQQLPSVPAAPNPAATPQNLAPVQNSSSGSSSGKLQPSMQVQTIVAKPSFAATTAAPIRESAKVSLVKDEVASIVGSAEAIRVAQLRISQLEKERDDLRNEISQLLLTSESLQKRLAESKSQLEVVERKQKEKIEILEGEKIVNQERLKAREKELGEVRSKNEEMDLRFKEELKKIRVREREYENKNMILRAESIAVSRSKDEMIMDLKRKLDQLQFEIDNYKSQNSKNNAVMDEWRERQIRTVKALRLALSIMEGSEGLEQIKKASGND